MTDITLEKRALALELAPRAAELADRLVASGPKASHVSASETHEIAEFVHLAIAALRLSAGADWPEPTDDMVEAGRTAVMALECSGPKWTVRQHYDAAGADPAGIPDELLDMHCPMPKAARAELIYRAMLAAAPRHEPGEV